MTITSGHRNTTKSLTRRHTALRAAIKQRKEVSEWFTHFGSDRPGDAKHRHFTSSLEIILQHITTPSIPARTPPTCPRGPSNNQYHLFADELENSEDVVDSNFGFNATEESKRSPTKTKTQNYEFLDADQNLIQDIHHVFSTLQDLLDKVIGKWNSYASREIDIIAANTATKVLIEIVKDLEREFQNSYPPHRFIS